MTQTKRVGLESDPANIDGKFKPLSPTMQMRSSVPVRFTGGKLVPT